MSFLPNDYKIPSKSNYAKFAAGENIFRIMSNPIIGWEWWVDAKDNEGKEIRSPKRVREEGKVPSEVYNDEENTVKHFWAMVVWNYQDKRIQILEITQAGIQKAIKALYASKGWGDPKNYDISITRTGSGMDTRYSVMPIPPSKVDESILSAFNNISINLEALYEGKDPFAKASEEVDSKDLPF